MSRRVLHDLHCVCGRRFPRALYHTVDIALHPGLRYAILGDLLNVVQCPGCERVARVNLPYLYTDKEAALLLYVFPNIEGTESDVQVVDDETPSLPETTRRPTVVHGVGRLIALIDGGLGDDEGMGTLQFDVRPSRVAERAARELMARLAARIGGYIHSWRVGERLHLQILGPRFLLDTLVIEREEE